MMNSPFITSCRQPRYSSPPSVSAREIPVQRITKTNTKPSHKVISIPVHYVSSERIRSDSVLKIQKVVRGFLVRKNMKRITAISNEVDEIERRVSEQETLELIKKDGKERLRVNETIMDLLLRLDSVRSINPLIRAWWKSVINKAIALQEKVDQISSADSTVNEECFSEPLEVKDSIPATSRDVSQEQNLEFQCEAAQDISEGEALQNQDKALQHVNAGSNSNSIADHPTSELHQHVETKFNSDHSVGPLVSEIVPVSEVASQCPKLQALIDAHNLSRADEGQIEKEAKENDIKDAGCEASYESDSAEESVGTISSDERSGTSTAGNTSLVEGGEENCSVKENSGANVVESHEPEKHVEFGRGDEGNRSRNLLERMMEDNERMMNLMSELFEKNERQSRLVCFLSNRVEQLEKALVREKSRRKKRRKAAGIADDSDKCGKR